MLGEPPRLVVADREMARALVIGGAGAELDQDGEQQDREDPPDQPERRAQ
jgi:hypothetical protein